MAVETESPKTLVGAHEFGHALVAYNIGGASVIGMTAEPHGSTLGETRVAIDEPDPIRHITIEIAILAGSYYAEEKVSNHDHRGCTHDQSVIEALKNRLATVKGESYANAVVSEARSIAHAIINQYSSADLLWLGQGLAGEINRPPQEEDEDNSWY